MEGLKTRNAFPTSSLPVGISGCKSAPDSVLRYTSFCLALYTISRDTLLGQRTALSTLANSGVYFGRLPWQTGHPASTFLSLVPVIPLDPVRPTPVSMHQVTTYNLELTNISQRLAFSFHYKKHGLMGR